MSLCYWARLVGAHGIWSLSEALYSLQRADHCVNSAYVWFNCRHVSSKWKDHLLEGSNISDRVGPHRHIILVRLSATCQNVNLGLMRFIASLLLALAIDICDVALVHTWLSAWPIALIVLADSVWWHQSMRLLRLTAFPLMILSVAELAFLLYSHLLLYLLQFFPSRWHWSWLLLRRFWLWFVTDVEMLCPRIGLGEWKVVSMGRRNRLCCTHLLNWNVVLHFVSSFIGWATNTCRYDIVSARGSWRKVHRVLKLPNRINPLIEVLLYLVLLLGYAATSIEVVHVRRFFNFT